ncbi:MAG: pseudouridine synthase [Spirochaetia bacterium]
MSYTNDRSSAAFSPERLRAQRVPVLYRDEHIAVVDKPAGLMVHSNAYERGAPNCINILGGSLHARVRTVHRLDRRTSGVLLFALSREGAAGVSSLLKAGEVDKRYVAVVRGHPPESGLIDRALTKTGQGARLPARTGYERLSASVVPQPVGPYEEAWLALVRLTLYTGKRHQARRHLHYETHPIIGDPHHGDKEWNAFAAHLTGVDRLYLRSWELSLTLPHSGRRLTVRAGLPSGWMYACERFGLEVPEEIRRASVHLDGELLYEGQACEPSDDFLSGDGS